MFGGIIDKLKEYVDTRLQLYQVIIEEKITALISNMVYLMLLIGVGIVALLFVLLFMAKLINYWSNNDFLGYGIVASLCVFLLWLLARAKSQAILTERIKKRIILTTKK